MTVKELEEMVEQLSHQFNEKVEVLSQQSNDLQELILSLRNQFIRFQENINNNQLLQNNNQQPEPAGRIGGALVQPRHIRLDFSVFSGEKPTSWIFRYEQYQRLAALPEIDVLSLAIGHLDGDAVPWSITKLRQTGTVIEYQRQFERLADRTRNLPESFFISCFLSGLREDIKIGVQMVKPVSLLQTFELARFQEEYTAVSNRRIPPRPSPPPPRSPPFRCLSVAEQTERRAKGLCFNCDEQFKPGHRCKAPQLLLLDADIDDQDEQAATFEEFPETVEVSLKALTRATPQNTMRLKGTLKKHSVTILIDSDSTHNFLNPSLAKQCRCLVTTTTQFQVTVADGGEINSSGKCSHVSVNIQGFQFHLDFFLLPIMAITTSVADISAPSIITKVLETYSGIFAEPTKLSPERLIDHRILLLPGSSPVNVRPYRYPHFQKQEIDRLIRELLDAGLIRHSVSPYSSPVLLVKKKDGSWRMCIDYRALNKEYARHLSAILQCLQQNRLYVKLTKCSFAQSSVECLGHIVYATRVAVNPEKVQCMLEWPKPTTIKTLRGFLGLTGYYRKFVVRYGKIAAPLTDMLKQDSFTWSPTAEAAFDELRQAMASTPVLALPNFTKPFSIECDASGRGIGPVLMQEGRPLAYISKALSRKNLAMSTYDKNGVHRLSKYAHFSALSHPYTTALVAKIFVRDVAKLHGMPHTIVSDRDPIFLSQFWEEFFQLQGSSLCRSFAYHPQTDGQTEVVNRSLEGYLSLWSAPPQIESYLPGTTNVHTVDLALYDKDLILCLLKDNLEAAQSRMKFFADKKRTERVFAKGDWVYLRLQPYRQSTLHPNGTHKLSLRYYGPFWILSRIGTMAYKLDLPATSKVHPVFHVSCLKRKLGVHTPSQQLPDSLYVVAWEWQPLAILDHGIFKRNNRPATKLLVQWQGQSKEEATWEECSEFAARFPSFQLADKLPS
ncbi:hypothetical protein KPL70_024180 [Citrus sinensis]|nr:hypothetical protein KPL70_024180 [Citrus sinensis]